MILTGCASFGNSPTNLPPVPTDLPDCFNKTVEAPPAGIVTKAQILRLIAELKRSETEKSMCGNRLIAFYESLL
jgi:hypothetical protein